MENGAAVLRQELGRTRSRTDRRGVEGSAIRAGSGDGVACLIRKDELRRLVQILGSESPVHSEPLGDIDDVF